MFGPLFTWSCRIYAVHVQPHSPPPIWVEYVCGRYNPTFFSETYDDETITIDLPIVRRDPSDNTVVSFAG